MKRNTLTTAVIAGLSGVAGIANISNAVNINPDGLGEILVYPYYTVRDGQSTILSVVNTTEQAKAVKVRFLEGRNSVEVLDFNLYLSMYDVWTGTVFDAEGDDAGLASLTTEDRSCTVPDIARGGLGTAGVIPYNGGFRVEFITANLADSRSFHPTFVSYMDETREGHVEMIEMGVLTNAVQSSAFAATHQGGEPWSCQQLNDAWTAGHPSSYWLGDPTIDIDPPIGGLFGNYGIINGQTGVAMGGPADAIDAAFLTENHADPGNIDPDFTAVDFNLAGMDNGTVTSIVFNAGNAIETTWNGFQPGVDAVSAVYMHDSIMNEYAIETNVGGESDWVVTFPTKKYYVNSNPAIAPFTRTYTNGEACEDVQIRLWDREEREASDTGDICFSPCNPVIDVPQICFEANVISFEAAAGSGVSNVLGSTRISNIDPGAYGFQSGWMYIDFWEPTAPGTVIHETNLVDNPNQEGHIYYGLPVTGFWAQAGKNDFVVDGTKVNFGALYRHRATRDICAVGCS